MKKSTRTLRLAVALFFVLAAGLTKAQLFFTLNGGNATACYNGGATITASVTVPVLGVTNYTWSITSFSNACAPTFTPSSGSGTFVAITACPGMYTVCCAGYNGTTIVNQCQTMTVYPNPTITATSGGNVCAGTTVTLSASGANTYTWIPGNINSANLVITPTVSTCYTVVGTSILGCTGSAFSCVTVSPLPSINITGNDTVCRGTSSSFTASGALTYTWSTLSTGASINVSPNVTTTYSVGGTNANGCTWFQTVTLFVDTMCSDVWPGDANSDGNVDNTDVFEIGLAFSNTGAARTPGGNSYTAQHATNWTGLVSTGKNKCHADCNGDGTVNNADTVAIFNNYGMTHSFKEASSANPDIYLDAPSNVATVGSWNVANIMIGSATSPQSLYGVAFDINYDNSQLDANSAYIVYTSSFLNASSSNVEFRKTAFGNGKVYGATVRTSGSNVSGSGQIGQFWYKVKNTVPANATINLSVSNAKKIEKNGTQSTLAGASTAVSAGIVGISEQELFDSAINLFPNPASSNLSIAIANGGQVSYSVLDITGREVSKGEFTNAAQFDISSLSAGTYIVRLQSGALTTHKKLVVEK